MASLASTFGSLDGLQRDAEERVTEHRPENDRIRQAWALALAQRVTAELPPSLRFGSDTPSPNLWQRGDAGLTATAGRQEIDAAPSGDVELPGSAEGSGGSAQGIVAEVDGGQLGRVKFSVNRSDAGLNIVIGASDPYALVVLDLERNVLLASLRAGGVPVSSVSVTSFDRVGIPLAPVTASHVRESVSKIRAYKSHLRADAEEADEGLDLIG